MPKRDHSRRTDPTAVMVRIVVAGDGTLTVTVDGAPYLPPEYSPPWRRASFPRSSTQSASRPAAPSVST